MGDLTQCLVRQGEQHPPGLALIRPEEGEQLLAVEGQAHPVALQPLRPHLNVVAGELPAVHAQTAIGAGLTAHHDIPVRQHPGGGVSLEAHQFKEFEPVPLRRQDQLIFAAVEAKLKGDIRQCRMQELLTLGNYLLTLLALHIFIHDAAQFRFTCLKSLPGLPGPLQEAGLKPGQGEALAAALDEFHGVGIAGPGIQSLLEVAEGRALLVQIVVGVGDTEIPEVVPSKIVLMGL